MPLVRSQEDLEFTNYYLKILPIHESRKIAEKIIPFQTQFPPLTNLTRQLGEWSDLSQAANQRAASWRNWPMRGAHTKWYEASYYHPRVCGIEMERDGVLS